VIMVRAIMIVEVAGQPPEHVKEHLEKHIGVLNDVNDLTVHSIKVSEPKEIEGKDGKGLFTCFAEADFESKSFARLSETMFDFMPSSVEVVEPSRVEMDAPAATDLLNNISGRLHRYDQIAMIAQGKIRHLTEQLQITHKILVDNGILELKDGNLVPTGKGVSASKPEKKKGEKNVVKKKSSKKAAKKISKKKKSVKKEKKK